MAEPFNGMHDILFGYDTDIHFENGDLMLTTGIDYIERELYKLLITMPGDWKANPKVGASPETFIGEENSRETGRLIQDYLLTNLRDTVSPAQVSVVVVPTDYSSITIFIDVFVSEGQITSIPFSFDFVNGIKKLDKMDARVTKIRSSERYKINDISDTKVPNKYWKSIREDYITQ